MRALIVDDDANSLRAMAALVQREGFTVSTGENLRQARERIKAEPPDVVLADLMLPDGSGLDLLADRAESGARMEVVLITGHASVETAVQALRLGVADYLTKPVDVGRLKTVLANLTRTQELKGEILELRGELRRLGRFGPLVGTSAPMQQVYDLISRVAPTDATVLITGESGTGKELVAETVHRLSRRGSKPFLAINCGAISPTLIESELFGHERGSFTGAERSHKGYFERADGGSLFLDEISEMPPELQVKLLRVLETASVQRVGGDKPMKIDVRVIAASNRDLDEAVSKGKVRQDLLYRLKVFPIGLPPLRDRPDDIEPLTEYFLDQLNDGAKIPKGSRPARKRLSAAALAALRAYSWPGNVRELKNGLHRAFILADNEIQVSDLPAEIGGGAPAAEREAAASDGPGVLRVVPGTPLAEVERRLLLASLDKFGGDKQKTAEALGVSLKTVYNRLKEYQGV